MNLQKLQQEIFDKLKQTIERVDRPDGETDDDLIKQIRLVALTAPSVWSV